MLALVWTPNHQVPPALPGQNVKMTQADKTAITAPPELF